MMKFLTDNWQLVFGGLGTAVVAAIVGAWAKSYFERKSSKEANKSKASQHIQSGSNSQNVQAGRDATVGDYKK